MQYVFMFFLLLLVGSAIGYVVSKKDIISAPVVILGYILLSISMPNDISDIISTIINNTSNIEGQIIVLCSIFLILTGLIFGIAIRFALGIFEEEKTPIGYGVIAGGIIVALINSIWVITFAWSIYKIYNQITNMMSSLDLTGLFNMAELLKTPKFYNITLWTVVIIILIVANYINRNGIVKPDFKIAPPVNQGNLIKRKADVVVYSDDLELLDSLVLNGSVKKDKYQQIIVDIEMQDLSPHFNAKVELKEEVKPEVKEEVKPEVKEEVKPEVKEEVKPEVKEEVKPEAKEEVKPEAKEVNKDK